MLVSPIIRSTRSLIRCDRYRAIASIKAPVPTPNASANHSRRYSTVTSNVAIPSTAISARSAVLFSAIRNTTTPINSDPT